MKLSSVVIEFCIEVWHNIIIHVSLETTPKAYFVPSSFIIYLLSLLEDVFFLEIKPDIKPIPVPLPLTASLAPRPSPPPRLVPRAPPSSSCFSSLCSPF